MFPVQTVKEEERSHNHIHPLRTDLKQGNLKFTPYYISHHYDNSALVYWPVQCCPDCLKPASGTAGPSHSWYIRDEAGESPHTTAPYYRSVSQASHKDHQKVTLVHCQALTWHQGCKEEAELCVDCPKGYIKSEAHCNRNALVSFCDLCTKHFQLACCPSLIFCVFRSYDSEDLSLS